MSSLKNIGSGSSPKQNDVTDKYRDEIHSFAESVESLLEALPTVMSLMKSSMRRLTTDMETHLVAHATSIEQNEDGQKYYLLEGEPAIEANARERQISRLTKATTIVHRSFLISIVSQYDAFLGRILRLTYLSNPKLLLDSKQSITIRELLEYTNLADAREELIEREIDSVARKSHEDQLLHCKDKYSVNIVDKLAERAQFVELTQRRHLFVHCDGVVSSPYLAKCREADCKLDDTVAVGTQLDVDRPYLEQAYEVVYAVGIKVGIMFWLKHGSATKNDAFNMINNLALELIDSDRHRLAIALIDFARSNGEKVEDETTNRMLLLNLAQAHKWSGDDAKCSELLDLIDWKASSAILKMGAALLADDESEALRIMQVLVQEPSFDKINYKKWPIFRRFRESIAFQRKYHELYGIDFGDSYRATPLV